MREHPIKRPNPPSNGADRRRKDAPADAWAVARVHARPEQPEGFDRRAGSRHFTPDSIRFVAKQWTGATPTGTIAVIGLDITATTTSHATAPPIPRNGRSSAHEDPQKPDH
jgi:hypothetical protein